MEHLRFKLTSKLISKLKRLLCCRYGNGVGSCTKLLVKNGCNAAIVTIHGDIVVAKFLAVNGPNGIYSHFWMSRALQSFINDNPKMWFGACSAVMRSPNFVGALPMYVATSNSKSCQCDKSKSYIFSFG